MNMSAKTHELLPHSPYSPDLTLSDFYLFVNVKKMFACKKFGSNEELITETEAYFARQKNSFCQKDIEVIDEH